MEQLPERLGQKIIQVWGIPTSDEVVIEFIGGRQLIVPKDEMLSAKTLALIALEAP